MKHVFGQQAHIFLLTAAVGEDGLSKTRCASLTITFSSWSFVHDAIS
jgi:hypothetical protein